MILSDNDGVFTGKLSGELTRHTVPQLSEKISNKLLSNNIIILDLLEVTKIDTAGLAWILAQIEIGQANACQLSLSHLPSDLIKLATLSGVDSFLPLHSS